VLTRSLRLCDRFFLEAIVNCVEGVEDGAEIADASGRSPSVDMMRTFRAEFSLLVTRTDASAT